ncbi:hypothetical protein N5923_15195 [Erwiniaceae bacterium BAC15a-03b]|uniref:Uncharacterized protein n=1 Tax=Winslowiella arboricola TaxID=2978220 RepID=A0A9J6PT33_9GAMM|nr:hypothetical protein [Winslowiella arboricola]MCU5774290.1 hypothetical protein [Winslowiella arboricola]MCU5778837.1 hypothetical protein [Winslowiella arboricola]
MSFSNVFVCCPANTTTGGPELLHQFVNKLQGKGVDAYILYYPFDLNADTPNQYKHYHAKVATLDKVKSTSLVILPETATKLAEMFPSDNVAIWWLSVDNYFGCSPKSFGIAKIKHVASLICHKKLSFRKMRNFIHLHQSEYAKILLAENNISSLQLTDYISGAHFASKNELNINEKKKLITYNPKKGFEITRKLIDKLPEFDYVPLINMSPSEVNKTLASAMIYIDFGNHPGKDRFPREAALANCCVITGRRGSAQNNIDLPLPDKFKIEESDPDFIAHFEVLCRSIFDDFANEWLHFHEYRESIQNENNSFEKNVEEFITKYVSLN